MYMVSFLITTFKKKYPEVPVYTSKCAINVKGGREMKEVLLLR